MIAWVVSLAESFTIPDAERLCWLDEGLLKIGRTTVDIKEEEKSKITLWHWELDKLYLSLKIC